MRVALVHELLTMRGGAETFLRVLADMFPDAPIHTFLYDEEKLGDWFSASRVRTSVLQNKDRKAQSLNHHLYINKFPRAAEAFDFSEYDLVISSSSAFAHGITVTGTTKHLSYIHSPARYLWDRTHDVQERANHGLLGPLKKYYLERSAYKLRQWDCEAADRAHAFIAASKEVQRRIELYWNKPSTVICPPIDDIWFSSSLPSPSPSPYFLIVSTLSPYKQIDLAIHACNQLRLPLVIAGDGPDRARLEKLSGPTIRFTGFCHPQELKSLYANARAVIFPGYEDFGLVPLESMACGTPVIGYRGGGALETIIEHVTGAFFDEQTPASLASVLQQFDHKKYSSENCLEQANKFRKSAFEQQLHAQIDRLMAVQNTPA